MMSVYECRCTWDDTCMDAIVAKWQSEDSLWKSAMDSGDWNQVIKIR